MAHLQDGGAGRHDLYQPPLEQLVAVEAEVPDEPGAGAARQPVPIGARPARRLPQVKIPALALPKQHSSV